MTVREEQVIARLYEFMDDFNINCAEDIHKEDSMNEECMNFVEELVEIIKG